MRTRGACASRTRGADIFSITSGTPGEKSDKGDAGNRFAQHMTSLWSPYRRLQRQNEPSGSNCLTELGDFATCPALLSEHVALSRFTSACPSVPASVETVGEVAARLLKIYLLNHQILPNDPVRQPDWKTSTARLAYDSGAEVQPTVRARQLVRVLAESS